MARTQDLIAMEVLEIMKRAFLRDFEMDSAQSSAFPEFSDLHHPGAASQGRSEVTNDRFPTNYLYFFKRRR